MVEIVNPGGGQIAGISAAEIISVPYYELLHADPDRACREVQALFSRVLENYYRQVPQNSASLELLFQSIPIKNQTYDAQVKSYLILRMLGAAGQEEGLRRLLGDVSDAVCRELSASGYTLRVFAGAPDYTALETSLAEVRTEKIAAVARRERLVQMPLLPGGFLYYNDIPEPADGGNETLITNALTQYPNSAVSLQLIPTAYTDRERQQLGQTKLIVANYAASLRMRQGPYLDSTIKNLMEAVDDAARAAQEPAYYFQFLVYGDAVGAVSLGSKLISLMEREDRTRDSAFELADLTGSGLTPGANFPVTPWVCSNALVYQYREQGFWGRPEAPTDLLRLRYLLGPRALRAVFRLPVDDGGAIGLESRRTQANREKLNQNVISKDSFRVGVIRETADGGGEGMHAGIPLDDFTKHGLIVGMSGSGKTNFSLGMLLRFWKEFHIPFLAIEPTKSEYRSLLDAIPELQIFTPGKSGVSPYIINPFLPPANVTVESYAPSLMTAFRAAFPLPNPLPNVFQNAINAAYTRYGWKKRSTSDDPDAQPFGMYEFLRVFQDEAAGLGYKGESKANIESAGVLRLRSLLEQNSVIYDSIHTIPLEELISRPTVIELNAITDKEQKSLIMAFLLIMICIYTKNNLAGDGKLKNILLIDEAHVLLGGGSGAEGNDPKAATIEAVEDMIAEIRSYGTGILIADQNPTKVGKNIVANTNVKVMFKLVERENRDAVASTTNMSPADYEELARLGVGQAMLHYGRLNAPLHIMTYDLRKYAQVRQVVPDEDVRRLGTYWESAAHRALLIPHRECAACAACRESCDLAVRDDAEYVAARLLQENAAKLTEKPDFLRFLVRMDPLIDRIAAERPSLRDGPRLRGCVKIHFLRRAILDTPFPVTETDLRTILKHPNFLKTGDE